MISHYTRRFLKSYTTSSSSHSPKLVFYHNPHDANSQKTLQRLRDAQLQYPNTKFKQGGPLPLDITVLERLPTVEELQDIYALLAESSWTIFFKPTAAEAATYRTHPTSARSVLDAIATAQSHARATNPDPHPLFGTDAFHWPVVVSWHTNDVALGGGSTGKSVQPMLKKFQHKRDGVVIKTPQQIREEDESAKRARWEARVREKAAREASPPEEETLEWFKQSTLEWFERSSRHR